MTTIDPDALTLAKGKHDSPDEGMCLLEAVSVFAGERFTDHPSCVAPVLCEFGINLNDRWDDEARQQLKRFIPLMPGTTGDGLDEARGYLALDWLIRSHAPAWLDSAGFSAEAAQVRALPRVVDSATAQTAERVACSVRTKVKDTKGGSGWDDAWEAAWVAWAATGRSAAVAAAGAARICRVVAADGAAGDAASWSAARSATRAAWHAAGIAAHASGQDAVRDTLRRTVALLQASALDLFDAMIHPAVAS